jgi:hypothetical protein
VTTLFLPLPFGADEDRVEFESGAVQFEQLQKASSELRIIAGSDLHAVVLDDEPVEAGLVFDELDDADSFFIIFPLLNRIHPAHWRRCVFHPR